MSARPVPRSVGALALAGYAALHVPLLVLALFSFNDARWAADWRGGTLRWYAALLERPEIGRALRASVAVGAVASTIATALGTLLALALVRGGLRRARAVEAALWLPVVTPEIVTGVSLVLLFSGLGIELGYGTVIAAHVAFAIPFVTVVVLARLRAMDGALEEAAMSLGADELATFRRVTLPLLAPAVLSAWLLAFVLSVDDFVITFFVAGPGTTTLPLLVYAMARRGVEPVINAVSTLVLAGTVVLLWLALRLTRAPSPPPRA
ncbi:MAG: ABC transporter permease [Gemmatimonadales bacterium]|nr:ABC transporter permease [Gemmatimonadales bacterium]